LKKSSIFDKTLVINQKFYQKSIWPVVEIWADRFFEKVLFLTQFLIS